MKNSLLYLVVLVLAFFIISASSCHKEDPIPDLVPITTTGANTMGFYVDGVPVNIKGKHGGLSSVGVKGGIINGEIIYLLDSAENSNPINSISIYLPIDQSNVLKEYKLNNDKWHYDEVSVIDHSDLGGNTYKTDSIYCGFLKLLKLDSKIISGTFFFDAIDSETGKVIHITDGRFDFSN